MRADLLLDVVKAVEAVPEDRFNMDRWWCKTKCGTVGCAIGHYCNQNPNVALRIIRQKCFRVYRLELILYQRGIYEQYNAISKYFDITYKDATYLFYPHSYKGGGPDEHISKSEVISRILKFVEKRSPKETKETEQKELLTV